MKANTEKFDALVSNKTSGWHKDINERISNKAWQDKAFDIALKVTRHLRVNKISQVRLADDMGMKAQSLNRILQGKENLTLETICRIESALGIELIEVVYSNTEAYEPIAQTPNLAKHFTTDTFVIETVNLDSLDYQPNAA